MVYRGRFAPSPSGPLHLGSLVAALGSYLDARANRGDWLVRIDDVDRPRTKPGAETEILKALEAYGLHWDQSIARQSANQALYSDAIETLKRQSLAYLCTCSRSELAARSALSHYDRQCLKQGPLDNRAAAVRFKHDRFCSFEDQIQIANSASSESLNNDFIIFRRDQIVAYQLAVVVDDQAQGITNIVRGSDLLLETCNQIALQKALSFPQPQYAHLPLIVTTEGLKLSKQTAAKPLSLKPEIIKKNLYVALAQLGQAPPQELQAADKEDVLAWGVANWCLKRVPETNIISQ